MLLHDVTCFYKHIEGTFRTAVGQSGDPRHFGKSPQVFEEVRFVDKQPVDPQFLEGQKIIFLFLSGQLFQPGFPGFFRSRQFLDDTIAALLLACPNRNLNEVNFVPDVFLHERIAHFQTLKRGMGDQYGIPIAGSDPGYQPLASIPLQIVLAGQEEVRSRIGP